MVGLREAVFGIPAATHQRARLAPDQRRVAREQYKSINNLPPDQKNDVKQKWQEYQSLPPEQKRELASRPNGKIAAPAATPPGNKPGASPAGQR